MNVLYPFYLPTRSLALSIDLTKAAKGTLSPGQMTLLNFDVPSVPKPKGTAPGNKTRRARKGGETINGKFYAGGKFIPASEIEAEQRSQGALIHPDLEPRQSKQMSMLHRNVGKRSPSPSGSQMSLLDMLSPPGGGSPGGGTVRSPKSPAPKPKEPAQPKSEGSEPKNEGSEPKSEGTERKKYYVSVIDPERKDDPNRLLHGPHEYREDALALVDKVRAKAQAMDPKAHWYEFGTAGVTAAEHKPGIINKYMETSPEPAMESGVDYVALRGAKTRTKRNEQVQALLNQKKTDFTPDELKLLAGYSGRGGLKTDDASLNEYYTRSDVSDFVWNILEKSGFKGGLVLEPSCATGVFLQNDRPSTKTVGIEIDPTSAAVAKALNPNSEVVQNRFERYCLDNPDAQFDAVVGNVPFGVRMTSSDFKANNYKSQWRVNEDMFVDACMDQLRPEGIMAMIVPHGVVTGSTHENLRSELLRKGRVLGAYRLPEDAFTHSGTNVVTDILVVQKHPTSVLNAIAAHDPAAIAATADPSFLGGGYFENHPEMVLGKLGTKKRGDRETVSVTGKLTPDVMASAPKLEPTVSYEGLSPRTDRPMLQVGDRRFINGKEYVLNENHRWERVDQIETDEAAVRDTLIDADGYGVDSLSEAIAVLEDVGQRVSISPEHLNNYLELARQQNLDRSVIGALQDAAKAIAAGTNDAERDKVAHAVLLASALKGHLDRNSIDTILDSGQALALLQQYRANFGNPSLDKKLSAIAQTCPQLFTLQGAFDDKGTISDYFADPTSLSASKADRAKTPVDAMESAFREVGDKVSLEEVVRALGGDRSADDVRAELLSDPTVGYLDGYFQPINSLLVGDGYRLLDTMLLQADALPDGDPVQRKLMEQVSEIRNRLNTRSIDDMTVPLWAAGKWVPLQALSDYMQDAGYHAVTQDSEGKYIPGKYADPNQRDHGVWGLEEDTYLYLNRERISHGVNTKDAKDAVAALERGFADWLATSSYRMEVEDGYNRVYASELPRSYSGEPLNIDKITAPFALHDYNAEGVRQLFEQGRGILSHGVGLGKAQPLDALVFTEDGFKPMGEIQVGDRVVNSKGGLSNVVGIFPQGTKKVFRVSFSDGSSTECCDEHLWSVQTANDRVRRGEDVFRVMPLSEFKDNLKTPAGRLIYSIPMVKAIQLKKRDLPINPYLLGLLLGDGSFRATSIDFATQDKELVEAISNLLPEGIRIVHRKNSNYRISKQGRDGKKNELIQALRGMGLWDTLSNHKFIPDLYKYSSIDDRLSILQGLMDSDGSIFFNKTSCYVSFSSASLRLTHDVQYLVESLGGKAPIFENLPKYEYKGEIKTGVPAYHLNICLPSEFVPVRLERKLAHFIPRYKYMPIRKIVSVEAVGEKICQCIAVDAPDSLYVTDHCILTHNTPSGIHLALLLKQEGRSQKPCIVAPKSVLANWIRESSVWCPTANILVIGQTQQFWKDGSPQWDVPGYTFKTKEGIPVLDEEGNYLLVSKEDKKTISSMSQKQIEKLGNLSFKDDDQATKQRKLQQARQNDYDFVLMSEPVFQSIGLDPETEYDYMKEVMGRHINDNSGENQKQFYQLQQQKEAKLNQLNSRRGEKTEAEVMTWEKLGLDAIIHDEAHHLRNLFSAMRQQDVAFLSSAESNRALDFYYKAQYTRQNNANQNVYMLTATPTVNNPLEAYHMLQFICPEEFDKRGIYNVDDFLQMFGDIQEVTVPNAAGELTTKRGLIGFKNLNDLRSLFTKYTRLKTAEDVGLEIPEEDGSEVRVDMTPAQEEVYESLRQRAEELMKGTVEDDEDHIFSVISDMDKAALDLSYYASSTKNGVPVPDGADMRSPKVDECIKRTMASLAANKGKQIIFCDANELHESLRDRLVAAGYPENEIQIVNAKTAKSSSSRQAISNAYNSGRTTLVIGNTATMGEGMNFQMGTTDIHHLNTPWTPAAITQRNGRGVRQGNTVDSVGIHYYQAKRSFDGYRHAVIQRKRNWINELWQGTADTALNQNSGQLGGDELAIALAADPEAARAALAMNREAKERKLQEEQSNKALRQFSQLQGMKTAFNKLSDERKKSRDGAELSSKIQQATQLLANSPHFEHKNLLDSSTPAYVSKAGSIVKQGDFVEVNDGHINSGIYKVLNIDHGSRNFALTKVLSTTMSDRFTNQGQVRGYKFDLMDNKINHVAYADGELDALMVDAVSDYSHLHKLTPQQVDANREALSQNLKNGYSYVPYITADGAIDSARIERLPDGAQVLWPHSDSIDKVVEAIAKAKTEINPRGMYKLQSVLEQVTDRRWYGADGLEAELRPKIEQRTAELQAVKDAEADKAQSEFGGVVNRLATAFKAHPDYGRYQVQSDPIAKKEILGSIIKTELRALHNSQPEGSDVYRRFYRDDDYREQVLEGLVSNLDDT